MKISWDIKKIKMSNIYNFIKMDNSIKMRQSYE